MTTSASEYERHQFVVAQRRGAVREQFLPRTVVERQFLHRTTRPSPESRASRPGRPPFVRVETDLAHVFVQEMAQESTMRRSGTKRPQARRGAAKSDASGAGQAGRKCHLRREATSLRRSPRPI